MGFHPVSFSCLWGCYLSQRRVTCLEVGPSQCVARTASDAVQEPGRVVQWFLRMGSGRCVAGKAGARASERCPAVVPTEDLGN